MEDPSEFFNAVKGKKIRAHWWPKTYWFVPSVLIEDNMMGTDNEGYELICNIADKFLDWEIVYGVEDFMEELEDL